MISMSYARMMMLSEMNMDQKAPLRYSFRASQ